MTQSRGVARERHPRHERRGEARLPGVIATLVAVLLYVALPQQLLVAPRYVLPALELLLLIPLIAINPRRLTRQTAPAGYSGSLRQPHSGGTPSASVAFGP